MLQKLKPIFDAIEQIKAKVEQQPDKWVLFDERKPTLYRNVLITTHYGRIIAKLVTVDGALKWRDQYGNLYRLSYGKHWHELPAAPNTNQNN